MISLSAKNEYGCGLIRTGGQPLNAVEAVPEID